MAGDPFRPSLKTAAGRGELSAEGRGARKAIEEFNRQRQAVGMTPGEFEERNLKRIAVDTKINEPVFTSSCVDVTGITRTTRR